MTTRIILPRIFRLDAIDRFAQQIVGADNQPLDRVYEFDFRAFEFIDGSGYTVFSNTMAWLQFQGVKITFFHINNINRDAIRI